MALIKCPECGKEISDKAGTCPSCGYSIKPTTIEKTSKKYKKMKLISAAILCGVILIEFLMYISGSFNMGLLILTLLGLIAFLVMSLWARYGAWWNNG